MRKINENLSTSLKIDVVNLSNEFPDISIDKLASELANNLEVNIRKEEEDGTVYMIIDDTDFDTAIDEISDIIYAESEIEDLGEIRPIIEDCVIEDDDENLTESIDEFDEWEDGSDEMDYDDYPPYYDEDGLGDEMDYDDYPPYYDEDGLGDEMDYDDYPPYNTVCVTDECRVLSEDEEFEDEEFEDEEFDDDDALNDCDKNKFDECNKMEDKEFECYESKKYRYKGNGIYERKKECCPPKKHNARRMVNLSESLKRNKLTTRDIVKSAKKHRVLTESIINKAMQKAKAEKKNNTINSIKESLGTDKYNMIVKAMKSGKKYLYENKKINGKKISAYSSKELYKILKQVQEQYNSLNKKLNSLNESASLKEEILLNEKIDNKFKLMNIIDEELTYRLTIKNLLKESDEGNLLEPLSVDPNENEKSDDTKDEESTDEKSEDEETTDEENPEEDEEVELTRVVITVANQEAADELKASMVDAGIPEDAIEFETESEEEEESEESEEETEGEGEETEGETEEETAEEPNESLFYNKFKKLLEDEGDEESGEDAEDAEGEADAEEGNEENAEGEAEEGSDEAVKVVLTNTDYINDLADVLDNEYGITKDEFEEMIGGEIIEDDSNEDSEDEDSENKDDDEKSDDESSKGDDAVDAMTPEELDKLFGNS